MAKQVGATFTQVRLDIGDQGRADADSNQSNHRHADFQSAALPCRYMVALEMTKAMWWPGAESNHRHADFQSAALPTELPGHHMASNQRQLQTAAALSNPRPRYLANKWALQRAAY